MVHRGRGREAEWSAGRVETGPVAGREWGAEISGISIPVIVSIYIAAENTHICTSHTATLAFMLVSTKGTLPI